MFNALERTGKEVLIIRGLKVIGRGLSQTANHGWVGIRMLEGEPHAAVQAWLGDSHPEIAKHAYIRYSEVSGAFFQLPFKDDETQAYQDADEFFDETYAVDEFNFKWGLVPDIYKDVEGYGSSRNLD